jgi:hypothetical protein
LPRDRHPLTNNSVLGIIEYTTAVPYPLKMARIEEVISPDPLISEVSEISNVTCAAGTNSECFQKFRMYVHPNGACRLNGEYTINVSFDCRNIQCPRLGFGSIVSTLSSEDFCNVIRLDIDLTGSMTTYKDNTMTQLGKSFVPSEFPVFVTNVESTRAVIQSSSLVEVFFTLPDGSSNTLYTGTPY